MIDRKVLDDAGIDYDAGMERFMNDADLYELVLTAFANEDVIERARAAFGSGDRDSLVKIVHEAKGSGGNAGLDEVYGAASALVALLRGGDYTNDELARDFKAFDAAYTSARDLIKAALH